VGVKCGTLSHSAAEDLAVLAAEEAIKRSGIDKDCIDASIGANVYQFTAPDTQDIYFPRNVALRSGLRTETPALMVQRICGSGLQTVVSGFQQIALPEAVDDARVTMCFAAEAMSLAPRIMRSSRRSSMNFWEFREECDIEDSMLASLNHDLADTNMMATADEYGWQQHVTRRDCDEFAEQSHQRAREANRSSHFNGGDRLQGMFAIDTVDLDHHPVHLARDECVRETSIEVLERLPGLTEHGLVSPGNASEISDGGAAIVLADRERAETLGLSTQFEIAGYGVSGVEPRIMGRGPVPSIRLALDKAGLEKADVDLWEINEAFAAQYLGVERELELDREKTNVNGGAIAIGHPLAATGARLIVDLLYEMKRREVEYGCASACIGGGQGVALILHNTDMA
jgi:acetyl-CoA C-acetyltransferase